MIKPSSRSSAARLPGTPADFSKLVADETAKWEKVVNAANLSIN